MIFIIITEILCVSENYKSYFEYNISNFVVHGVMILNLLRPNFFIHTLQRTNQMLFHLNVETITYRT